MCMQIRGVQKQNSVTTTSAFTGAFLRDIRTREAYDTLFISYVNVQETSKCTCYSYHQFLVPSVDGYRYVKFNDEVFRLEASNKVIACEYNPEFKYGYCVEKGLTHL